MPNIGWRANLAESDNSNIIINDNSNDSHLFDVSENGWGEKTNKCCKLFQNEAKPEGTRRSP
ncbi:hypothetical protein ETAR_13490 [Edwardsiella tarda]